MWGRHGSEEKLARQLPDVASEMARLIESGSTLIQAIAEVPSIYDEPIATAFDLVLSDIGNGHTIDDALSNWSTAASNDGVGLLVGACRIGSTQGGNLVAALEGVAGALTDSLEVAQEVRALTAQARTSAIVLTGLPAFGLVLFAIVDPSVIQFLVSTTTGWVFMSVGVVLNALGAVVMASLLRWSLQ